MFDAIDRRFTVPVPIEVAWDHLANVEQWTSWATHIKHIELESDPPLNENSKGHIQLQNGIKSSFSVTEINLYENWKWVGPFLWLTVYYDHRFHAIDENHTEMIFLASAEGFGVSVVGRFFAWAYNRNLDTAIPNLIREYQAMA